ncbi:MAG: hypothetical protein A2528_00640 [Candidatus Staskawiczbacteria bacterium RIFOXYD2_FULL_37_9]|uniref:Uncharacterized protein n=1 Tax=Candidatus Staskawiczbacteria bacterium RIFOXYB1_FULL_37_44 TaxID=1802223 RepID=A0A1G2IW49_9BACT|nr:MAG: hypothetical protein A2358_03830 [Candidatus Staskawiczbacteria bacterium RIFOXYB1_FULL_37_44]OGZ84148.1 MAG: hypothetical protein A2416_03640 [Candidatus Staskawiczbacteria bacterium RIFOXYC1_FULL_37_52]OGZ89271.1 MAG: hypothetical protein A2444_02380 [Candidatus Staskawiczbacteria bacterium RIFOXYC2_FULL_37_19]OGZ89686.1 MAG: hypothetical protein A2581_02875 [Candidatus Staskawiczbacteria bacterium RIFOXYD1_FULL_37_110]OGZ93320.1 MAG: hypothetical protein A2528_00640 [Candidatus Stask
MAEVQLDNQENYRTEYREVATTYRFQISLRFIINAFTATIQSALLSLYGQALQKPPIPVHTILIPVLGIIMMFAVFAIEQRTISVFRAMIRRGKDLEFNLGLIGGQFSWLGAPEIIRPKGLRRFITHTWGIRLIYGVISTMWIVLWALLLT